MKRTELKLNIISAEKTLFAGMVSSVVIPGISGRFGVYPDHAPFVSPLKDGVITYVINDVENSVNVKSGIAEVNAGVVTICVERAEV